eukprot:3644666-Amphidinium_carterae.2
MLVEVADVAGFAAALAVLSVVFTVRACCRCTGGCGGGVFCCTRSAASTSLVSAGGRGSAAGTTFAANTVCRGFRLTCFAAWVSGRALLEAGAEAARSAAGPVFACAGGAAGLDGFGYRLDKAAAATSASSLLTGGGAEGGGRGG